MQKMLLFAFLTILTYIYGINSQTKFIIGNSVISINNLHKQPNLFFDNDDKRNILGKDMRYDDENDDENEKIVNDIYINMEKKYLLSKLSDNNTSIPYKLQLLDKYKHLINIGEKVCNLYAGGLMQEYLYDFHDFD